MSRVESLTLYRLSYPGSATCGPLQFIGSIGEAVSEELLRRILETCGPLRSWKRILDANSVPRPFGFAESACADALLRAERLLVGLPLFGRPLSLKTDEQTSRHLQAYEAAQNEVWQLLSIPFSTMPWPSSSSPVVSFSLPLGLTPTTTSPLSSSSPIGT